ncbi:MAG TPA: hypothetical protein VK798_12860 [Alloacidobacterium sp.]|jgi:hypothetical protein|nr:hypothetical protein [Alloacidobacterium sp.]
MEAHGHSDPSSSHGETIHLPAPTAWPIVLAFGITLILFGVVTNAAISILGGVLAIAGSIGWFRQVLPHEAHEDVPVEAHEVTIASTRTHVTRVEISEEHRAHLPVETYPVLSGIKGGIAGGIAMIFPALLYGILSHHSIWYPVNLLGGAGVANWTNPTTADIAAFHWEGLLVASIIHVAISVLVGLLYGAMLPMLPRHPILLGGLIAPLLWTGLLHSSLGIVNPVLDEHIAWGWFVVSQIAFGLVAGFVVARQGKIRTDQSMPFVLRMGIEASGMPKDEGEDRH